MWITRLLIFFFWLNSAQAQTTQFFNMWGGGKPQWTDFGSNDVGIAPSDWTRSWNSGTWTTRVVSDTTGVSGKTFTIEVSGTALALMGFSWRRVQSSFQDGEILGIAKMNTGTAVTSGARFVARGSGINGSQSGYVAYIKGTEANRGSICVGRQSLSATTEIACSTPDVILTGTYYRVRFRVQGTNLSAKIWMDGTPEPAAWSVTGSNSAITSPGWVGVAAYAQQQSPVVFSFLSYVKGTSSSPTPPCRGVDVGGYCWYLGSVNQSCTTVCASRGYYHTATGLYAGWVGTESQCQDVLTALGETSNTVGSSTCGLGLGCGVNTGTTSPGYFRCTEDTTADDAAADFRRACACTK